MDLNKQIVGLYKQREDSVRKRNQKPNSRRQENNKSPVKNPDVIENPVPEKKKPKVDDILAQLSREPKTTFDNLYGCDEIITELREMVDRFKHFLEQKVRKSKRPVLICGSEGLGKTSLIEATANYAGLKLYVIPFKKLRKQNRNELDVTLNLISNRCKSSQPAIILVDDIDLIFEKEGMRDIVIDAIDELIEDDLKLLVFCTASSALDLNTAIRFKRTIYLRRPDTESRWQILRQQRNVNENLCDLNDESLKTLAINTPSFTVPDLEDMHDIALDKLYGDNAKIRYDLAINIVKRSLKRGTHLIGERPSVTWDDIGGLPQVRHAFCDIMKSIKTGNINCKFAGIILYGPPGCGKTMVAQAMANEAGLNFIAVKGPELFDKFLGETEKNIRNVFREAKEHEPCMIYFDEFDGLCKKRGDRDNVTNAIQALLSEMDGFDNRGKSIILASTNRLQDIDPAIIRSGRLSKHIKVDPPNHIARLEILRKLTKKFKLSTDVDLVEWADNKTQDFTGADLSYLIEQAENEATRYISFDDENKYFEPIELTNAQLQQALEEIKKSIKTSKE